MLENSCHPISIPPDIWLSPYFQTSILGHGLSPYFQGPGCHPTSVGLFLFSPEVTPGEAAHNNDQHTAQDSHQRKKRVTVYSEHVRDYDLMQN